MRWLAVLAIAVAVVFMLAAFLYGVTSSSPAVTLAAMGAESIGAFLLMLCIYAYEQLR